MNNNTLLIQQEYDKQSELLSYFCAGFLSFVLLSHLNLSEGVIYAFQVAFLLMVLLLNRFHIYKGMAVFFALPATMLFIGLHGFFYHELYNSLKGGWYFSNLIITVLTGYICGMNINKLETILKIFLYAGVALSLTLIYQYIISPPVSFQHVGHLRQAYGKGAFDSLIGLIIIFASRMNGIQVIKNRLLELGMAAICITGIILSFSRTMWLLTAFAAVFTYYTSSRRRGISSLIPAMAFIMIAMFLLYPLAQSSSYGSIGWKLSRVIEEITPADYYNKKSVALHWRGYETYQGIQNYLRGNYFNYIFGFGFGKLSDMGFVMKLGGLKSQFIPVFHNGYIYVLINTGFVGLLLFIGYIAQFIFIGVRNFTSENIKKAFSGKLLIMISIIMALNSYVGMGLFNKISLLSFTLLMGVLVAYLSRQDSNNFPQHGGLGTGNR